MHPWKFARLDHFYSGEPIAFFATSPYHPRYPNQTKQKFNAQGGFRQSFTVQSLSSMNAECQVGE